MAGILVDVAWRVYWLVWSKIPVEGTDCNIQEDHWIRFILHVLKPRRRPWVCVALHAPEKRFALAHFAFSEVACLPLEQRVENRWSAFGGQGHARGQARVLNKRMQQARKTWASRQTANGRDKGQEKDTPLLAS